VASAQALAPRTAAANRIGVKFFIPESLVFERGMAAIARAAASSRARFGDDLNGRRRR
jgi:hypothetical protein